MAVKDKAASVLARLRAKAREIGESYQQTLLLFCQEEFLRRLENSPYADNLILKGGLFLYLVTRYAGRTTMDADFLLHHHANDEESLQKMLETILDAATENDFVTFTIKGMKHIALHQNYHGVQASLMAHIKQVKVPFYIDFGVGDIVFPSPERRSFGALLKDSSAPSVLTYSLESTIAEKYDAIVQRMEQTSRMKDFYDIYYLSETFEFDGEKLQEAIQKTLAYRGTKHTDDTLLHIAALGQMEDMRRKWLHFRNVLEVNNLELEQVVSKMQAFLTPVVQAMQKRSICTGKWSPAIGWSQR